MKKPIYKKWWLWAVIIIIGIVALSTNGGKKDEKDLAANSTKKESTKKEEKKEDTKITYENFLNIKMGDSLENVNKLLGEGKEETSSEIGGTKTAMYAWKGKGLSTMNVTIQNKVVTNKTQLGLKEGNADVNMDKYNQVKEGMSYEQVKAILGEGELISHSKIGKVESIMYSWTNKGGSNMNATFTGGKLSLKSQFNLK